MTPTRPPARDRGGKVLIYAMFAMPLFLMLGTLAVDWGRVQLVKTELERATQAAARAAVPGIQNGTYLDLANWVGAMNPADGTPVEFTMADVEIGRWDPATRTLLVGVGSPNAVRATARRTVPASFGGWSGVNAKEVVFRATARFNVIGFGLVGLDWVNMSGNSMASYSSGNSGALQAQGNIGSNGNITLGGSTVVNGNTFVGAGRTVTGGTVTGSRNTLAQPLSYPNGDASPYGPSNNDNGQIPSWAIASSSFKLDNTQSVSLPGGNYFFNNFDMTGGSTLTFTGPATVYCYGTFSMSGRTNTSGLVPGNLKLVMVPNPWSGAAPGSVSVGSSSAFYGQIYAPQSAVSIGGTGDVYGSVLGRTVNMTGTGRVVYDLALEADNGTIALVE
jgi:Flp pilus assembly protein TadG